MTANYVADLIRPHNGSIPCPTCTGYMLPGRRACSGCLGPIRKKARRRLANPNPTPAKLPVSPEAFANELARVREDKSDLAPSLALCREIAAADRGGDLLRLLSAASPLMEWARYPTASCPTP